MTLIHFNRPFFLLLVPVAVALVLMVSRHCMRRRRLVAAIRLLIALCIVLSISGPHLRRSGRRVCRIFVVDASASASASIDNALGAVRDSVERMKSGDLAGLIVFGSRPAVELAPGSVAELSIPQSIRSKIDPDGSDVAEALLLARSSFPDGPHRQIVLLWDGNTASDVADAAAQIGRDGIELAVVPLDPGRIVDARIESLSVPRRVRTGQKVIVEVVVAATAATSVNVELACDRKLCARPRWLRVQGDRPARMMFELDVEDGWHDIEARIVEPEDAFSANDRAAKAVYVGGRTPVLVVSSAEASWLARALASNRNLAVTARAADGLPEFARYDCVVLDDVPAWQLGAEAQNSLDAYVGGGGGLVVLGGARAFGPGGYVGTRLENLLPVSCDPRRRESKPVAVAIVLDKSGSMNEKVAGRPKIDYARLGVLRVMDELKPDDQVSLIVFDATARKLLPLTRVADAGGARQIVARVFAAGRTNLNPALDAAWRTLKDRPRGTSHVLLLSDGLSDEAVDAEAFSKRMKAAGITLSSVATGDDADVELLEHLARATGGRFYSARDVRRLPEIFSSDVRLRTQKLIVDGRAEPKIARGGELLGGISQLPELGGYILTAPRDGAAVHAVIGEQGDALLVSRYVGLGRVVAFTSTPGGRWGEAWRRWPERSRFWNQIIRWAARPGDGEGLRLELAHRKGFLLVTAKLDDVQPDAVTDIHAKVLTSSGEPAGLELRRTGVRTFEGRIEAAARGAYSVEVRASGAVDLRAAERIHTGYSDDWRSVGLNEAPLRRTASAAGGEVVADLQEWSGGEASGRQLQPVAWLLMLAAAALFLLDRAVS